MDAEQLGERPHGPARRQRLLQVPLETQAAANDLFTTLMGDDVEPRREFIEKHALGSQNIDVPATSRSTALGFPSRRPTRRSRRPDVIDERDTHRDEKIVRATGAGPVR